MIVPIAKRRATVLLVDDHPLLRKGLRTLLQSDDELVVVGEATDGTMALEQVKALTPDVVIMDITMPKLNGIESTRLILAEAPDTRIVALSIHAEKSFIDDMLEAGAAGYVLKDRAPEELVQAIHAVLQDEVFLSAPILGTVVSAYRSSAAKTATENAKQYEVATVAPILHTKLHRPALPRDLVPRTVLLARLEVARPRLLTLVSAPAGYGKSILICSWLDRSDWPSAWLSLDQGDGDLRRFILYFLASVRSLFPQACEYIHDIVNAPELPTVASLAPLLVNELDSIDRPFVLVLDDYHTINVQSPVNELLQFILQYSPVPLHLVLISRRDPPLPLVLLRASEQVSEIRMHDLRFSAAEVCSLLEKSGGYTASDEALANLEQEIEGWAVGLRLVSLAIQRVKDPEGFMKHLHGGLQQTQEYMTQEVIEGLPPELRDWLLKTSILDRFCGPLCDAVCAGANVTEMPGLNGGSFIKALIGENLFVIPLDNQGEWFRHHHLFQDLLQNQLRRVHGATYVETLYARAAEWFESQGLIDEAIGYAQNTGDAEAIADIVTRHRNEILDQDKWYVLENWLEKLSAEIFHQRPVLLLGRAYVAFFRQRLTELDSILKTLETSCSDEVQNSSLGSELNFFRGYLNFWEGNTEASQRQFEAVIKAAPQEPKLLIAETELHLSLVRIMRGSGALAIEALNHRIADVGISAGPLVSRMIAGLAMIYLLSAKLVPLKFEAQRLRELAKQNRTLLSDSWGYYLEATSDLNVMDMDSALTHFSAASNYPHMIDAREAVDAMACIALTHQLNGRTEQAQEALQRLVHFVHEKNDPVHISVARACEARIGLLQGNLAKASHWAAHFNEPIDPFVLFLWQETPHITQARVLIAEGTLKSLSRASELLQQIRDISEACHFTGQIIEVAVLQSLLLETQGHSDAALAALDQALVMAEPGGWVRPFVELGKPMAELLGRLADQRGDTGFLHRLRKAIVAIQIQKANAVVETNALATIGPTWSGEQLTKRELEILKLVANRLQNKEIASRLFVSPETVKTHLKHLYQKLGVSNRREAAAKAAEILNMTRPTVQYDAVAVLHGELCE